jgi:hypothetical protein
VVSIFFVSLVVLFNFASDKLLTRFKC